MSKKNSILVIGKPSSGKSSFFGQLYTRLNFEGEVSLTKEPKNISSLDPVINSFANSRAIDHTESSSFADLTFELKTNNNEFSVDYPDYGGEQVNHILQSRNLNSVWFKKIKQSDYWMLFVRLSDVEVEFDPIQRFNDLVEGNEEVKNKELLGVDFMSFQSELMELVQILLFHKKNGFSKAITTPKICVVLSCWDKLDEEDQNKEPVKVLKQHLPLFSEFMLNNWDINSLSFVGLSSQGKELKKDESDPNWMDVDEGYIIEPNGEKSSDLTRIFKLIPDLIK